MENLTFKAQINAPAEKVWNVLWNDKTYREWTSVFSEGSHAKSDWKEGSRIEFLDGKGHGMYSEIEKLIPNSIMVFKHLGEIKEGKDVKADWGEGRESYYLTENEGKTYLEVSLDSVPEFLDYFSKTFPLALQKIKEISEK